MKHYFRIGLFGYAGQEYDYTWESSGIMPCVGGRVRVPLRTGEAVGIVLEELSHSALEEEKLKSITKVIDTTPLLPFVLHQIIAWASQYYHYALSEAWSTALPVLLREGVDATITQELAYEATALGRSIDLSLFARAKQQQKVLLRCRQSLLPLSAKELQAGVALKALHDKGLIAAVKKKKQAPIGSGVGSRQLELNPEQSIALSEMRLGLGSFQVFLLAGITGSGKTEVYLQLIADVLERKIQVLVLVPEISLTPQTVDRFKLRFCVPIVVMHSELSDKERLEAWLFSKEGEAAILIGTRSAVFTPFKNLGLIIVDEEHDTSFKQQEGFRYHARDVAIMRAKKENIPLVLGSATPSLESLFNVERGFYRRLLLLKRAGIAEVPKFCIVDLRGQFLEEGIAAQTVVAIRDHLQSSGQVLVFINRRGFSPGLLCHQCGWSSVCLHCDAKMTWHYAKKQLQCHHCDYTEKLPSKCTCCGSVQLMPTGSGTERVEIALAKHFPDNKIERIDRDTTRNRGALAAKLSQINQGQCDILVGTQMLAKGHHFPKVTLVVILNADAGLYSVDFRAEERVAQLIIQVAGRAGREHRVGTVLIQTHNPEHPLLTRLIRDNYFTVADHLLKQRKEANLPPYAAVAFLRASAKDRNLVHEFLRGVKKDLHQTDSAGERLRVQILGPVLPSIERIAGRYFVYLIFQAQERRILQAMLTRLEYRIKEKRLPKTIRWALDVDPQD